MAGLLQGSDGRQGRAAGGHHVLHDDASLARIERGALDPSLQAVCLGVLADEKGLGIGAPRKSGTCDGVGPHRQAAHGRPVPGCHLGRQELPQGREALRPEDRPLGIHVVLGHRAAGQRDLPDHQGVLAQLGDQPLAGVTRMGLCSAASTARPNLAAVLRILAKLIRVASVVICLIVVASFIVFAVNQTKSASGHQREVLGESSETVNEGKGSTEKKSSAHKALDEASSKLTSPFSGIVTSSSEWAKRSVELVLALLVYGFGLGYVARVLRVRS